jgi:hypothetical protein
VSGIRGITSSVVVVGAAVVVGGCVVDVVVVVFLVVVGASVVSGTVDSAVSELAPLSLEQAAATATRPLSNKADVSRRQFVVGRVRVIVLSAG